MGKTNIASSGFTPVQVGRIVPPGDEDEPQPEPAPKQQPAKGRTVNVRSGNAKVGKQADIIVGDLRIRM